MSAAGLILAPLRGVTIRCFRETFAREICDAGFTEAVTPFISAIAGLDPLKDRELRNLQNPASPILITPQFIGKDPAALRVALEALRSASFATADLNCGCPFPMVRNKGRGSGLLRDAKTLAAMLDAGCSVMGDGAFSVKARLGVKNPDELLSVMPLLNSFPLRRLVVHARTAVQMYSGEVDMEAYKRVCDAAKMPVVYNGDAPLPALGEEIAEPLMIGRAFIRDLGARDNSNELLLRYISASLEELGSGHPVIGRIKELLAYWKDLPRWRRIWPIAKLARSLDELRLALY